MQVKSTEGPCLIQAKVGILMPFSGPLKCVSENMVVATTFIGSLLCGHALLFEPMTA